jgi:hypothetical protein
MPYALIWGGGWGGVLSKKTRRLGVFLLITEKTQKNPCDKKCPCNNLERENC